MKIANHESGQAEADLLVFREIARALTSSLGLDSILSRIMREIERVFQPETWALLLIDEDENDLDCVMADGRFGAQLSSVRIPLGEGLAGRVAERGEALILADSTEARLAAETDPYLTFEIQSAVCIPLRSRLRTLGVIQLFNLPPGRLSDYSVSFLVVLCDFAAIAIENARALQRVQELTTIDECTGLSNLRHFDQSLNSEIHRSERLHLPLSLIFLDLDHFKLVNDRYGHQAGSWLLGQVGHIIRSQVRRIDMTFRYGGDEFIVLLPGTPKRSALQVANRLLLAFREAEHRVSEGVRLRVTASFGVATFSEDGKTGAEILSAADARMYEVKATTGDGIVSSGRGRSLGQLA